MTSRLHNCAGFTIMEVLVSTTCFMIGFSILISLLSVSLVRLSAPEVYLSAGLAQEQMHIVAASMDTTACDTLVVRSRIDFAIVRQVHIEGGLAKISISVSRLRTGRELVALYHEVLLPAE